MGTSKKDKKAIKKIIEDNKNIKSRIDSVGLRIDEFIDSSDETKAKTLNELYAEWKASYDSLPDEECPPGQHKDPNGNCVPDVIHPPACPEGQHWNEATQQCVENDPIPPEPCPPGQHKDENGNCVPDTV